MLNRSLEIKKNKKLNHILFERNFLLDDSYKKIKYDYPNQYDNNDDLFNERMPEYEQRMPMRFGYQTPKENTKKHIINNRFDFDDNSSADSEYHVVGAEDLSTTINNFELQEDKVDFYKTLQKKIKNTSTINEIDLFGKMSNEKSFELFNNLNDFVNKKFTVSPYNLFVIMAALYKISNHTKFKAFFKYSRDVIGDGCIDINKKLVKIGIVNYNTLFINKDKFNMANVNDLEKFCHIETFTKKDIELHHEQLIALYIKKIQKNIQYEISTNIDNDTIIKLNNLSARACDLASLIKFIASFLSYVMFFCFLKFSRRTIAAPQS